MLTTANGWQKVTDISSLTLSDYYFAFVDRDNPLILSFEDGIEQSTEFGYKTMVYRTAKKAENTPAMLWTLDKNSNGKSYTIKSAVDQSKFLQTEYKAAWYCRTHDNGGGNDSWGAWNFSLADGVYTIENNTFLGNYVGPWNASQYTNGMEVAGNKSGDNIGHFYIYAIPRSKANWLDNASEDNPVDVTYYIANANAAFNGTNGWTAEGTNVEFKRSGTGFDGVAGFFEPSAWGKDNFDFNTTQTISNQPAGKYKVRAAGQAETNTTFTMTCGDDVYTFPANGATGGTIDQSGSTVASGQGVQGWNWGECGNILRTDGNLTITFHSKANAVHHWANFDNVELYFYGKTISGKAPTASDSPLSAEANTWYVFDVPADGKYKFTPTAGTIYYSQDGTLLPSEVTTSLSEETELTLTKGKLYVRASENATITLAASEKVYVVGSASVDGEYIQPGQTVTINYADAQTTDEDAVFTKLKDVTLDGQTVNVSVSGTNFSFTVPSSLTSSKTYTLSIPAGAFGYEGHTTCDAQELTLYTPAIFDGTYFVKATDDTYAGKYISRGALYNAEAAIDPYGLAMKVATDSKNVSTFTLVDNNKFLSLVPSNILFTDGVTTNADYKYKYNIAKVDGGYTFYNIDQNKYLAAGVRDNNAVAMASDDAYAWAFETPANHTASMTALKDAQAKAVAAKAGLSANTVAELESAVSDDLTAVDVTISLSGNEYFSDANNQGNATGTRSNTITIANAGLYKFTLPAYTRAAGANEAYAMHTTETEALVAYAFFGDNQTQVRSLYSEEGKTANTDGYLQPANASQWWANDTNAGTAEFKSGKYANDIWMYLEPGDYTFGITNPSRALCASWTWFGAPKLTYYAGNLYPAFAELYAKCKPWTTEGEYVTTYNSYAAYNESTNAADLLAAINYLNANYNTYAWDNASMEHPYLVNGVIAGADNTTNDAWPGNGRPLANGQHWSGDASRTYFTQNVRPNAARSQNVIIPKIGVYMLKTAVRTIKGKGKTYAIISVGNQSVRTDGATGTIGGTIATDGTEYESVEAGVAAGATFANDGKGYGWVYNKVMFVTTAENTQTNISINLSHVSDDGEADCGGMYLYYVGQGADNIVGNTHYYYGTFVNPAIEFTDNVPVVDATLATVNGATITRTNPNGLLYLANGSTADGGQNVIVDGTCANFVLADGHPFVTTKAFSATAATYTMTAIADGKFGTLMLPFAAQLPADGKAYALDENIDLIGGKVNGSEVTALTANTPVLVTKAGAYTASNVDIAATTATSFTNGNLTGVYAQTEAPQGSYVLQNHPQSQGVAFYLVGDVKPTVKPFRAYIPAQSSNAKAIKVVFDGEATAIDGIAADEDANENVYDLSGRKVVKAHKGVYIKNGKKVIVK